MTLEKHEESNGTKRTRMDTNPVRGVGQLRPVMQSIRRANRQNTQGYGPRTIYGGQRHGRAPERIPSWTGTSNRV